MRGIKSIAVVGLLALCVLWAQSTPPSPSVNAMPIDVDRGAAGLTRWLHALKTRASLLMITAHPDDEDGGTLAFETRGMGARAALLTLNRGEGGQNAMSADMYDALGLVRTQELLAADRYYGVDQYWTTVVDYGFSKTREEALEKWGHDRVLSDVVRVIRMTRPLVIVATFVGAASDGHGQHQVSGQMAQEAFLAAGDPTKFPEQIREGLRPWSPLKMYARVPFFDVTDKGMYDYAIDKYVPVRFFDYINQTTSSEKPSTTLEVQEGDYAPAPGLTYLQIGRDGLGQQKSQNNGVAIPPPGPQSSPYHRYGSRVPAADHEESFFDGIDASVRGIASLAGTAAPDWLAAGLAGLAQVADQANTQYQADHPQSIAPVLSDGLRSTRALIDRARSSNLAAAAKSDVLFELSEKESQFEHALADSLGVSLFAVVAPAHEPPRQGPFPQPGPSFSIAIPGQSFAVNVDLLNQSQENLAVDAVAIAASDGKTWNIALQGDAPKSLAPRALGHARFSVAAPADAGITRPYFVRPNDEQPYYNLADPHYRDLSSTPYPLAVNATVSYRGVALHLSEVVQAMHHVQAQGVLPEPLIVAPAISVEVSPAAGAVPLGAKSFQFACTVHSNVKGPAKGTVRLRLPAGWRSTPESVEFSTARDGDDQTMTFTVLPAALETGERSITAVAEYQGKTYEEGYRLTGYAGLRPYPYYRPAVYHAVAVDVKTADVRIGYVPGTGDEVPRALENLGRSVRTLAVSDITQGDLSNYDAIILGTRAYAVRPELKSANARLLDYVRNGGVLIVQYQLQDFDQNYGPYPFTLGSNPQKVVDEGSRVDLLKPDDPALTWPNRITAADFAGWVEERGHGFMQTWDPHYEALVETHDPDQDPQLGGLLLARFGKGAYIYDAFALYRQLPVGVPGAYRILANLVSLTKNPAFTAAAPASR